MAINYQSDKHQLPLMYVRTVHHGQKLGQGFKYLNLCCFLLAKRLYDNIHILSPFHYILYECTGKKMHSHASGQQAKPLHKDWNKNAHVSETPIHVLNSLLCLSNILTLHINTAGTLKQKQTLQSVPLIAITFISVPRTGKMKSAAAAIRTMVWAVWRFPTDVSD